MRPKTVFLVSSVSFAVIAAGWWAHLSTTSLTGSRPGVETNDSALRRSEAERARVRARDLPVALYFEENQGQTDPRVKFVARGQGYRLFLTSSEAVFRFHRPQQGTDELPWPDTSTLRMRLIGANAKSRVTGRDRRPGRVNYRVGMDPKRWKNGVPTYGKVHYELVYPGIDVVYYGNSGQLEYDFMVSPGADPGAIVMQFDGANQFAVNDAGDLILQVGRDRIQQQKPVAYQDFPSGRREIQTRYALQGNNQVALEVASYDTSQALIIDPTLWYSSYLGGVGDDAITGVAVESTGETYMSGYTISYDFPLPDANGSPLTRPSYEAVIMKFGPTSALGETPQHVYTTIVGGNDSDTASDIAVNEQGHAWIVGTTDSFDLPTFRPFQRFPHGATDLLIASLEPDGTFFSVTYLGGSATEIGNGVAVDTDEGYVWFTGRTTSPTAFPLRQPAFDQYSGNGDAFVTGLLFDVLGGQLVVSTYLGGAGSDSGRDIAVDGNGHVYVTGSTDSTDFPIPRGTTPFQLNQPGTDAFVAKFTRGERDGFAYATYLGGSGTDIGEGIAVDPILGTAFVTGITGSASFPLKTPFDSSNSINEAFVTKVNSSGSALVWSSFLGGTGMETGLDIALDSAKNPWITGKTSSADFPGAPIVTEAGTDDIFATHIILERAGTALVPRIESSTLLRGTGSDIGNAVAVDGTDRVYVAGSTSTPGLRTQAARQSGYGGGANDGFIMKLGRVDMPPKVSCAIQRAVLWPPRGGLIDVGLTCPVIDDNDSSPDAEVAVFSNEDDGNSADADVRPHALLLRAERRGGNNARVYLILVSSVDSAGNVGFTCSSAAVPHDQSSRSRQAAALEAARAETLCLESGGPPPGFVPIGD